MANSSMAVGAVSSVRGLKLISSNSLAKNVSCACSFSCVHTGRDSVEWSIEGRASGQFIAPRFISREGMLLMVT
ncbi:hypothetical protein CGQ24_04485 [Arthrobacter sp. 7749]|nr:hypothetical protein CGQ24_04485 [Arthrobacter sp. 7749]